MQHKHKKNKQKSHCYAEISIMEGDEEVLLLVLLIIILQTKQKKANTEKSEKEEKVLDSRYLSKAQDSWGVFKPCKRITTW